MPQPIEIQNSALTWTTESIDPVVLEELIERAKTEQCHSFYLSIPAIIYKWEKDDLLKKYDFRISGTLNTPTDFRVVLKKKIAQSGDGILSTKKPSAINFVTRPEAAI